MQFHIDGLVQNCSFSIATGNALEILQSCTKPLIYSTRVHSQLNMLSLPLPHQIPIFLMMDWKYLIAPHIFPICTCLTLLTPACSSTELKRYFGFTVCQSVQQQYQVACWNPCIRVVGVSINVGVCSSISVIQNVQKSVLFSMWSQYKIP